VLIWGLDKKLRVENLEHCPFNTALLLHSAVPNIALHIAYTVLTLTIDPTCEKTNFLTIKGIISGEEAGGPKDL
jgi:hypothetical protein